MKIVGIMLLAQVALGATYEEAKALADKQEAMLQASESSRLIESQGKAIAATFPSCKALRPVEPFTVVLAIDHAGKAKKSWRRGDSEFARCVELRLSESIFFNPPVDPFYTSLEFSFKSNEAL